METNPEHEDQSDTAHDKIKYSSRKYPTSQNDRGFWYSKSYPVILQRFNETRPMLVRRLGLSGRQFCLLLVFRPFDWSKIDVPACWFGERVPCQQIVGGWYRVLFRGQMIRSSACTMASGSLAQRFGRPPVLIKHQLANAIINYGDHRLNFATTTKLLHFMHPELFPIFDKPKPCLKWPNRRLLRTMHTYLLYKIIWAM